MTIGYYIFHFFAHWCNKMWIQLRHDPAALTAGCSFNYKRVMKLYLQRSYISISLIIPRKLSLYFNFSSKNSGFNKWQLFNMFFNYIINQTEEEKIMFNEYDDILNIPEVCEALHIGKNRVYELLNTGQLKGFRIGRIWKIPRESVSEYVYKQSGLR